MRRNELAGDRLALMRVGAQLSAKDTSKNAGSNESAAPMVGMQASLAGHHGSL